MKKLESFKQKFDLNKRQAVIYFLLYFLLTPVFYYAVSHFGYYHYSFVTQWDRLIPFMPNWIFIYHLYYPLTLLTAWLLLQHETDTLNELTGSLMAGNWLGILSFLIVQSEVPRPDVTVTGPATWAVSLTYRFDRPYNGFPSLHVITMTCVLICLLRSGLPKWYKTAGAVLSVLIIISTVLVKQHVLLDIPGGIAYAALGAVLSRYYSHIRAGYSRAAS